MGIAANMKNLARNIVSSRKGRAKRLGEIKEEAKEVRGEAQDLIENFQTSRKELKNELNEASATWQELTSAKAKNKGRRTKKWESQQE